MEAVKIKQVETSPEVKDVPQTIEMVDGNNYKYTISNPNHPSNCPQKGTIRIEAIRRSNIKQPRYSFSKIYDQNTGITYGIPQGIDKATGELKFKRIIVGEVNEFNCSNPNDRAMWNVFSRSERLLGSPFQSGKPLYKKYDSEVIAENIIKDSNKIVRAVQIAADLKGLDFYDMAINLGLSPENQTPTVLLSLVIKKATEQPGEFIEIYENINKPAINVFKRCLVTGLIESTIDQGFIWKKQYPLGMSESAAIASIIKNPALASQMDLESKAKSSSLLNYAKPEELTSTTFGGGYSESEKNNERSEFLSSEDLKNEYKKVKDLSNKLESQIEEMKRLKDEKVQVDVSNLPDDLDTLQEMAFKLGWAGANMCSDVEKLKTEIRARKK